ncbi:Bud site selection protein bud4 [Tilletia horrida]|nr:Bud site selection protein bud4 [Tilletia horrida]
MDVDASFSTAGGDASLHQAPPSPEITTKQILGASSSGWSPQRQVNRTFVPLNSGPSQGGMSESGSPRKSFAVLKSHSLVSNSVFRQPGSSSTQTPSPPSPSKKMGLGLGIGVNTTPAKNTITPRLGPAFTPRKLSGERVGSGSHGADIENQAPQGDVFGSRAASSLTHARMSKGIDALAKGSYVSNSPFKQINSPEATDRPLQPRNAWAMMAEVQATAGSNRGSPANDIGKPVRPLSFHAPAGPGPTLQGRMYQSPDILEDQNTTPRSAHHAKSASIDAKADTSARSSLVSNRLHGPRQMSAAASSPSEGELRTERRKTVTFDEILEVQEFDKESSFDRESTRSEGSALSQENGTPLSDSGQWALHGSNEHLQVVNGPPGASPASSTSEELPPLVPSSGSTSSEASTFDELPDLAQMQHQHLAPHHSQVLHHSSSLASIPSQYSEELSFDQPQSLLGVKPVPVGDESFNSFTGLHRVDSLVDELLQEDILNNSPGVPSEQPRRRTRRANSVTHTESPVLHQDTTPGSVSRALPLPPISANGGQLAPGALPDLPNWSPFVMPEGAASDSELVGSHAAPTEEEIASSSPTRSAAGRPRIARDAVLERVRAAKQEESQGVQSIEVEREQVPSSQTHTAALVDADVMVRHHSMPRTSSTPLHVSSATAQRPAPVSTPSYEARAAPAPSPVRHGVRTESPLDRLSAEVVAERDEMRRSSQDDGQNYLQAPAMTPKASSSSGRASPSSMLTPPPPPVTPAEQAERIIARRRSKNGGSLRKRSLSAGDAVQVARQARAEMQAEDVGDDSFFERHRLTAEEEMESRESIGADLAISKAMLDQSLKTGLNVPFTTGMERELNRIYKDTEAKYNTIDRGVIKGVDDKVQTTSAGDIDSGKAWRKLRRPSDMNEYAQELREIRESSTGNKPLGKIFVMVDSFIPAQLPIPTRPTRFYCVLDNGLHMVKTGLANLRPGAQPSIIGQEFELIQHKNLEFSFTLVAVRDPHLVEPTRAPPAPVSPKKQKSSPGLAKGVSRLFGSPKKQASKIMADSSPLGSPQAIQQVEPMLAYMNREGAFGRTRILFEELQDRCVGTCATFDCAVMGVAEPVGSISAASRLASLSSVSAAFEQNLNKVRGKLRLKIFYLPPIPNIPRNLLPDSLDECIMGMKAVISQKTHVWMEGTLTQNGGDCRSWRRRPVQAQGNSLICFNEITKRPIVKIDLSKAVQIEDSFDPVDATLVSPGGSSGAVPPRMQRTLSTVSTSAFEDADENYNVERSFRITFGNGERISFFADTDEEKDRWLTALREVIGKPSAIAPLWAHAANDLLRRIAEGGYHPDAQPAAPHQEPVASTRQSSSVSRPSQMHRQAEAAIPEEHTSTPRRATGDEHRQLLQQQQQQQQQQQHHHHTPTGSEPMQRAATAQAPQPSHRPFPEQRPMIPPRSFTQQGHAGTHMGTPEQHRAAAAMAMATPTRASHGAQQQAQQPPSSAGRGRGTPTAVPRRPVPMQ